MNFETENMECKAQFTEENYKEVTFLVIIVVGLVMAVLSGCSANKGKNQKSLSLTEYLSETNENWFLTGKKEYTIQAMMVSQEKKFHNDLEVVDYVAADDGETVVLKGTRDEIWTSPLSLSTPICALYPKCHVLPFFT